MLFRTQKQSPTNMNYQDENFSPGNPDSGAPGPSVNWQQLVQWIKAARSAWPLSQALGLPQSASAGAGAGSQAASLQQPAFSILGPTHPFDADAAYGAGTAGSPASSPRPYPDPATVAAVRKIRQEQANAKLRSAGTLRAKPTRKGQHSRYWDLMIRLVPARERVPALQWLMRNLHRWPILIPPR